MTNAASDSAMDQSNGEQNNGIIPDIPGGKPQSLPAEPQFSEVPANETMGCTSSTEDDKDKKSIQEKPVPEGGQQIVDPSVKNEKRVDNAHRNNNDQSPKRSIEGEDEPKKRPKSKTSAYTMSDDDDNENNPKQRQSGPITRSLASLPKLRITFDDSDDDEDSRYHSWAKQDVVEYRNNYPNARSNPKIRDNLDFYTNKMRSHPDGDFIDNIHKKWFGDYRQLEFHHGYIQWLFPLQEKGLNWSAEPLQKHEIESILQDKNVLQRVLKSYQLMLDFYGFELVDEKTGEIRRLLSGAYKERFRNLNTSSHNYLRITRILKCLGEFNYEYLKFPFLEAILRECITQNTLSNCLRSCKDYWIETLRSQKERRAIRQYARELIEYRNKEMDPPKSHRAIRSPSSPSTTTTTKIGNMSLSKGDGEDNPNQ